jgi:predicted ester cyclase
MDKSEMIIYVAEQLIGQGNLSIVDTGFSADYLAHAGEKTHSGHKFIKQFTKQVRTAIPEISIENIEIIAETDTVITWQRNLSGTHKAPLKGIPASNKKIKWSELVVSRFDKGKIVEEWLASDLAFQLLLKLK